jgi:hypothetical protein
MSPGGSGSISRNWQVAHGKGAWDRGVLPPLVGKAGWRCHAPVSEFIVIVVGAILAEEGGHCAAEKDSAAGNLLCKRLMI